MATRSSPRTRAAVALGVYGAGVAAVAFWPTPVDRPVAGLLQRVLSRLHELGVPSWVDYAAVEFGANVAMFVPFGALVAAVLGRRLAWAAVLVGAVVSVTIEAVQWMLLPERFPSGGDVLANTLGAALGAAGFVGALALRSSLRTD